MAVFRTSAAAEESILTGGVGSKPAGLAAVGSAVGSFARRKPLGAIGGVVIILAVMVAILAPWIAPNNPEGVGIAKKFSPPGTESAPLGTDHIGRDILSRLIHGARISMYVGVMTVLIGITAGTLVGIFSAYMGGVFDMTVQRLVDALMGFPPIILALGLMAALGADINNVIIALVVILVPGATRVVRSETLRIKELDYILASRAIGTKPVRVMLRHISRTWPRPTSC